MTTIELASLASIFNLGSSRFYPPEPPFDSIIRLNRWSCAPPQYRIGRRITLVLQQLDLVDSWQYTLGYFISNALYGITIGPTSGTFPSLQPKSPLSISTIILLQTSLDVGSS